MFGLELVGLALALFPLAIELLNRFEKTQVPEFKNLLRSVSNDYEIFRCSLKLILTEDELKLLASASGKSPLPDDILAALRESFDDDITLKTFEENVQEIGQCLEQLQRNLSKDDPSNPGRKRHWKSALKALKKRKNHIHSVDDLHRRVETVQKLVQLELTVARRKPRRRGTALSSYKELRSRFTSAHSALLRGWASCGCPSHLVNLRLDRPLKKPAVDGSSLFRLAVSLSPAAHESAKDTWLDVDLEIVPSSPASIPLPPSGSNTPRRHHSHVRLTHLTSAVALVDLGSSSTIVETLSTPPQPTPVSPPAEEISDLCKSFIDHTSSATTERKLLGTIHDGPLQCFKLYIVPRQDASPTGPCFSRLTALIGGREKQSLLSAGSRVQLHRKERLEVARTLAFSVFLLISTPWLDNEWTRESIVCIEDTEETSGDSTISPYMSKVFEPTSSDVSTHSQGSSTVAASESTLAATSAPWISNPTFLNLSLLLMELCLNRCLEDDPLHQSLNSPAALFVTGQALLNSTALQQEYGKHYELAVKACWEMAVKVKPESVSEEHQGRFVTDVIDRLEETCKYFGAD